MVFYILNISSEQLNRSTFTVGTFYNFKWGFIFYSRRLIRTMLQAVKMECNFIFFKSKVGEGFWNRQPSMKQTLGMSAIFDGHGGENEFSMKVSERVKEILTQTLMSTSQYQKKDYREALNVAFKLVDQHLSKKTMVVTDIDEDYQLKKTGCTAIVIVITPDKYYIANDGNSRSVLMRGNQRIDLSEDHKPWKEKQQQRIQKAGSIIQWQSQQGSKYIESFCRLRIQIKQGTTL